MSEQTIPVSAGYVFNLHNRELARSEWMDMLKNGRGLLYLSEKDGHYTISDWPGLHKLEPWRVRQSFHNMAGPNGRTDVWFNHDGSTWHGVNIGDNQILRVKRCKG